MLKEEVRNRAVNYRTFDKAQWDDVMPEFPFDPWLEEFGVPELESLVLYMTDYLGALDGILRHDLSVGRAFVGALAVGICDTGDFDAGQGGTPDKAPEFL